MLHSSLNRIVLLGTLSLFAMLLCLGGCGGGEFAPRPGPYRGELQVAGEVIGDIAFTAGGGFIAGTATLTHNEQVTTVAISGSLDGRKIVGRLHNENLGEGPFQGNFSGAGASGTFSYEDAGGISMQTGTWSANID